MNTPNLRAGYLEKLGGSFGNKWQKRYFVIRGSTLYWFKKISDNTHKGSLLLKGEKVIVTPLKPLMLTIPSVKKDYQLRGANKEEVDEWITAMKRAGATIETIELTQQQKKRKSSGFFTNLKNQSNTRNRSVSDTPIFHNGNNNNINPPLPLNLQNIDFINREGGNRKSSELNYNKIVLPNSPSSTTIHDTTTNNSNSSNNNSSNCDQYSSTPITQRSASVVSNHFSLPPQQSPLSSVNQKPIINNNKECTVPLIGLRKATMEDLIMRPYSAQGPIIIQYHVNLETVCHNNSYTYSDGLSCEEYYSDVSSSNEFPIQVPVLVDYHDPDEQSM